MALTGVPLGSAQGGEVLTQEPPERVTITATRTPTPIIEVPATVSVITSQQIDEMLATDIKDLVQFEPGVSVRSAPYRISAQASTGRGGNEGFNIRGLEGNRVLILADGIRVPDAFDFGPQAVGRGDYVDLSLLKSVEILRGPASALYGSDGVAGAVSFITKDPDDLVGPDELWHAEGTVGFSSADESWAERAGRVPFRPLPGDGRIHTARRTRDRDARRQQFREHRPDNGQSAGLGVECGPGEAHVPPGDGSRLRLTYDHLDRVVDTNVLSAHRQAAARQYQSDRISGERRDRPRPHRVGPHVPRRHGLHPVGELGGLLPDQHHA